MEKIGLYVHIPFCEKKCYYCDFNSLIAHDKDINKYITALTKEMALMKEQYQNKYKMETIFIGGGTPSLLTNENIEIVINNIHKYFTVSSDAEISIEVNPGTVTKEKLMQYLKLGINRLSFGLQSTNSKRLKEIGRIHTFEQYYNNVHNAKLVGFKNINTDLIFALPNQTIEEWTLGLKRIVDLGIPHISAYSLIIEEGTPFYMWREDGKLYQPDEDVELNMYREAIALLKDKGYIHYEISNFALPDLACRHNINYWRNGQYLGLGVSAHSHINNQRFSNKNNIEEYIHDIDYGIAPLESCEKITVNDQISETMFLGLRLLSGIQISEFKNRFGKSPFEIYEDKLTILQNRGLVNISEDKICLTHDGVYLSNVVFRELLL
ncbi:radical SAM family heme chaperone HemW [Serpentinicella sp. ANB-PHB4]|uniref:radical SAM family heme chaperone HemW n=1 Tax=Serpentinicella sp. ANB-PHB4 TaxID=3074076 RepID=UPI0028667651|nr:radical SAM family heme chaperone HemW [Serpentinicella sp. ANB-PHB4]MDR5657967.1 radical SAM family heme chaperone HemW [Serpentinicella sp. ANB-PHB4]